MHGFRVRDKKTIIIVTVTTGAVLFLGCLICFQWYPILGTHHSSQDPPGSVDDPPSDSLKRLSALGIEVLPRSAWRARKRSGVTGSLGEPSRITIHHQGGPPFVSVDRRTVAGEIRAIQRDHQQRREWVDIAYHFIVDPAGRIWEGRSLRLIGAHAGNQEMNSKNIGILVLGNFDLQTLTPRQEESLLKLIEGLRIVFEIDWRQVLTHDEVRKEVGEGGTECPGKHLDELVKNYRKSRAATMDSSSAAIRDSDR